MLSSHPPCYNWNIIETSTSLKLEYYRAIHLVTVGLLSSHPPRYSLNIIEPSTSLQLEYYRAIHLVTVGMLSSRPPRYSWTIIEHPPRYSWIIIELASSLRTWLRRGENYPKIKGFPRSKRHYVTYVKDLGMWFVYFKQFPTMWNSRKVSSQIQRWIKHESQRRFHDFHKGRYLHYIIKAR